MARRLFPALLLAAAVAWGGCAATREQITAYGAGYSEDPYEDLAPYGSWVNVASYGSVWCPEVSSAWEPYTVGYWVYTDDGWFWVSEDPWGSLPYHYGRWAFDTDYGWVWVPGDEWASAWVAWRYGAGWVGWAPLPPDVSWQPQVGLDLDGYDLDSHIDRWYFTKAQDFGTSRVRVHVLPADSKQPIVKRTRDVTKYEAGPRPIEVGMRPDLIQRIGDTKIERYQIVDSSKPGPKNGVTIRGTQAEVYRPHVDLRSVVRERPSVAPSMEQPKIAPASIERTDRETKSENQVVASQPVAKQRPEVKKPDRREPVHELRPTPPPPPPEQPKVRARDESEKSQSSSVDENKGRNVTSDEEAVPDRGAVPDRQEAVPDRDEARKSEDATPQRDDGDVPNREREIRGSDNSGPKGDAQKSEVRERDDNTRERDENARERERAVPEPKGSPEERTRGR